MRFRLITVFSTKKNASLLEKLSHWHFRIVIIYTLIDNITALKENSKKYIFLKFSETCITFFGSNCTIKLATQNFENLI